MNGNTSGSERAHEMDERQYEETKRFNSERTVLLGLAPSKWQEIKQALKEECGLFNKFGHTKRLEYSEPNSNSVQISRFYGKALISVATLSYAPDIPLISHWRTRQGRDLTGTIRMVFIEGSVALVDEHNSGVAVPVFLSDLIVDITR